MSVVVHLPAAGPSTLNPRLFAPAYPMENTLTQTIPVAESADDSQLVQQVYQYAAQQMGAGKSDAQIEALLLAKGLNEEAAQTVVSELRPEFRKAHKAAAKKDMLHGGLWFGGGLLVTGITYSMATEGGSYFMTWGAIIFGGFQFFKGLVRSMQD
jgi:hypothetical protein